MSSQLFCHVCGKTYILGNNFCQKCGTNLTSLASRPPSEDPRPVALNRRGNRYEDPEDDDEGDDHFVVTQTALAVEIIKDRPLGEEFSNVLQQGAIGIREDGRKFGLYKGNEDPKSILSDFRSEAGKTPKMEIGD